ncbi:MAG: hypothetical protein WC683_17740 [bacterium]
MDAKQLAEKLHTMDEVKGAEIVVNERRQQVEVYGFHLTKDFRACRIALENLGFGCMPNSGFWQGYVPDIAPLCQPLSDQELYERDKHFIAAGGHLADPDREEAIRSGKLTIE